jgi:hypothetical protein
VLHRQTAIVTFLVALTIGAGSASLAQVRGASAGSKRTLVKYQRTGGFAVVSDRLVVAQNGRATLSTLSGTRSALLSRRFRARLVRALRQANFAQLEPRYDPPNPVADALTYAVTYRHRRVSFVDSSTIPSQLQPAVSLLNGIVGRLSRREPKSRL